LNLLLTSKLHRSFPFPLSEPKNSNGSRIPKFATFQTGPKPKEGGKRVWKFFQRERSEDWRGRWTLGVTERLQRKREGCVVGRVHSNTWTVVELAFSSFSSYWSYALPKRGGRRDSGSDEWIHLNYGVLLNNTGNNFFKRLEVLLYRKEMVNTKVH